MLGRFRFLGRALFGAGGVFSVISYKNSTDTKKKEARERAALIAAAAAYDEIIEMPSADLRTPVDLVLHARWIVPMDQRSRDCADPPPPGEPRREYLTDHSIAVSGGRIVGILPQSEARAQWLPAREHSFPDGLLMPGMINAHTHTPMALFRSWVDGVGLGEWLQEYIWPAERRFVTPEFVAFGSRLAIVEMLGAGVTAFNDMYFFPEETARVALEMGVRAVVGLPVLEFPSNYASCAEEYLRKGVALLESFPRSDRVRFAWAPHAPYTVADETWRRVARLAEYYGVRVHTHVHEARHNVEDSLRDYGVRPLERLRALGVLGERLVAAHMTQVEPTDVALLRDHRVKVVHCPESNLKLASGMCPAGTLLRAGVQVALGTDGASSNDDLDLLGEARTASLVDHYLSAEGQPSISRYGVLEMATIGAARVLGIDDHTGSLEEGKAADIVALRICAHPVFDPLSTLTNSGINRVTDVWVDGKHLVRDGVVIGVNYDELYAQADEWGKVLEAHRNQ